LVCHACDNVVCVNPGHLWLGTVGANTLDAARKGRLNSCNQNGERNPVAKLTTPEVTAMRALYHAGGISTSALGRRFGISQSHAAAIVRGELWRHVPLCALEAQP